MRWNNVWHETVASHKCNRADHSVSHDTHCSPYFYAKTLLHLTSLPSITNFRCIPVYLPSSQVQARNSWWNVLFDNALLSWISWCKFLQQNFDTIKAVAILHTQQKHKQKSVRWETGCSNFTLPEVQQKISSAPWRGLLESKINAGARTSRIRELEKENKKRCWSFRFLTGKSKKDAKQAVCDVIRGARPSLCASGHLQPPQQSLIYGLPPVEGAADAPIEGKRFIKPAKTSFFIMTKLRKKKYNKMNWTSCRYENKEKWVSRSRSMRRQNYIQVWKAQWMAMLKKEKDSVTLQSDKWRIPLPQKKKVSTQSRSYSNAGRSWHAVLVFEISTPWLLGKWYK